MTRRVAGQSAAGIHEAIRTAFAVPLDCFASAFVEPPVKKQGRDAIGFYQERKDETRNAGLGPEHDWSSHAAVALGLMAICYQEPGRAAFNRPIRYVEQGWV